MGTDEIQGGGEMKAIHKITLGIEKEDMEKYPPLLIAELEIIQLS